MSSSEKILNRQGLYVDDLSKKLRLLHPDFHQLSQEVAAQLKEFGALSKSGGADIFQLERSLSILAARANRQRLQVVGRRSRILLARKDCNAAVHQLNVRIKERKEALLRLDKTLESLENVDAENEEMIAWLLKKA